MRILVELDIDNAVEEVKILLEAERIINDMRASRMPPIPADVPAQISLFDSPPPAEPVKITIGDLEAALTAYYKREGLPAAKAVLADFSAARVGDISEDFWPELMERLK